jgi:hypothetical protein
MKKMLKWTAIGMAVLAVGMAGTAQARPGPFGPPPMHHHHHHHGGPGWVGALAIGGLTLGVLDSMYRWSHPATETVVVQQPVAVPVAVQAPQQVVVQEQQVAALSSDPEAGGAAVSGVSTEGATVTAGAGGQPVVVYPATPVVYQTAPTVVYQTAPVVYRRTYWY